MKRGALRGALLATRFAEVLLFGGRKPIEAAPCSHGDNITLTTLRCGAASATTGLGILNGTRVVAAIAMLVGILALDVFAAGPPFTDDTANGGRNRRRRWLVRILIATCTLAAACGPPGRAAAQNCTVSNGSVADTNGTSCSIAPNTTLTGNVPGVAGNPEIYATDSAPPISQITTNDVTVSPNNGGSTGGLAATNGIIIFSSGSSINGNWATAASAQNGGEIIFEAGSTINPPFGGGAALRPRQSLAGLGRPGDDHVWRGRRAAR
jgi:hypothetical protein